MSTPAPSSFRITTAPDLVYGVWDAERFETRSADWVQVPGAEVHLMLGQGWPSYGAQFVATFSAEALCSDNDKDGQGVLQATVFFGDTQAEPVSGNHRFVTARGNPEWSSHTFIRTVRFEPDSAVRDVSARVKLKASGAEGGVQNWFLKIERFSL
ncbi:hypothetical protein J7I94_22225 [Streptomyces sp. ISL-12]|uniref:hypothetical protein n=1 Tax=Streptomyces sp. ISL-12 TaxID=2819177 RepID=UPI001BECD3C9|nr:hypothetical protein [Streptomyces sp. ISL-12]MBT2413243.1 hypothetical protein [Streptomyces sp. ISL-12]